MILQNYLSDKQDAKFFATEDKIDETIEKTRDSLQREDKMD